jgi:hypothetical protein
MPRDFLYATLFGPSLEPNQPPIQWVPGTLSLGVTQQVRKADHSLPTSAEVMVDLYLNFTVCLHGTLAYNEYIYAQRICLP